VGGIGILILGYGDGLASLVGRAVSSRAVPIFGGVKSLAGTSTMLIASAAVTVLFTQAFNPTYGSDLGTLLVAAGFTAAAATLVEFVTPYGMDNLTVPIVTTLFYNGVFV
jgi:phytol kinase